MKNKITACMIIVSILLSILTFSEYTFAATVPTFSITADKTEMIAGEEIVVTVWGQNMGNLYAYEPHISFDSTKIKYVGERSVSNKFTLGPVKKDTNNIYCAIYNSKGSVGNEKTALYSFVFKGLTPGGDSVIITLDSVKVLESTTLSETASIVEDNTVTINKSSSTVTSTKEAVTIKVNAVMDNNGTANVDIDAKVLDSAIKIAGNKNLNIEVQAPEEATDVNLNIPAKEIGSAENNNVKSVQVNTGLAVITLSPDLLQKSISSTSKSVQLSVSEIETSTLSDSIKKSVGNNTVYDFNLSVDGNKLSNFTGNDVLVSIKYDLKPGEKPGQIVIYYIDDDGNLEIVKNGKYNPATKEVQFKPKHFSKYSSLYKAAIFKDLDSTEWAKESIEALAARGVINGFEDGSYKPSDKITRSQFAKILVQAFELEDPNAECSFTDVAEGVWYYKSIASAQKLGIVNGVGDGSFAPEAEITRQDMATMAFRAAKAAGLNLEIIKDKKLFNDSSDIAAYAAESIELMQRAGIINGMDSGDFMPINNSTRAETAKIVYSLFKQIK